MSKQGGFWGFANAVGLFFVILFAICFAWYFVQPVEREMHLAMFKLAYYGLEDMNYLGFLLGAVQSYVWGYVVAGAWTLVAGKKGCNCCK